MVCYTEVSTIQRLFYMHSNLSGPMEAVCYREVSTIRGVCCKKLRCNVVNSIHTICMHVMYM